MDERSTPDTLHGTVADYLYPLLGHGGRMDATALQRYAPRDRETARADIRVLARNDYLEPERDGTIQILEGRGMERVAARTGEPVATEPATYTLGPEGERYVRDYDLGALEDSLRYVFNR